MADPSHSASDTPDPSPENDLPMGPGAAVTFIYYFSIATLMTALFSARALGVGLTSGIPGELALLGGLLSGTLGTFFNRSRTLVVPVKHRKAFRRRLESSLADMGYALAETEDGLSVYQRSRLGKLFSGDILVQERDRSVAIVSRAANIRTLERQLNRPAQTS